MKMVLFELKCWMYSFSFQIKISFLEAQAQQWHRLRISLCKTLKVVLWSNAVDTGYMFLYVEKWMLLKVLYKEIAKERRYMVQSSWYFFLQKQRLRFASWILCNQLFNFVKVLHLSFFIICEIFKLLIIAFGTQ